MPGRSFFTSHCPTCCPRYSEDEAESLIWSGGLKVIVCQDPEIQEIADSVVNDTSYWPEPVYQLNYALTLADKETKVQTNYSVENLESWFAEQQGYDYSARYYSEDEARAAADEFRDAMVSLGSSEMRGNSHQMR